MRSSSGWHRTGPRERGAGCWPAGTGPCTSGAGRTRRRTVLRAP
ncbi:TPA_asm: UL6.7 sORF 2 [Human alphaherpesvirus 1]|nr:TPA_asm: UL6.7 sORF 2 [Human alphaherpesvirus 1]